MLRLCMCFSFRKFECAVALPGSYTIFYPHSSPPAAPLSTAPCRLPVVHREFLSYLGGSARCERVQHETAHLTCALHLARRLLPGRKSDSESSASSTFPADRTLHPPCRR